MLALADSDRADATIAIDDFSELDRKGITVPVGNSSNTAMLKVMK